LRMPGGENSNVESEKKKESRLLGKREKRGGAESKKMQGLDVWERKSHLGRSREEKKKRDRKRARASVKPRVAKKKKDAASLERRGEKNKGKAPSSEKTLPGRAKGLGGKKKVDLLPGEKRKRKEKNLLRL